MSISGTLRRRFLPAVLAAGFVLTPAAAPAQAAAKSNPEAYAFLSRQSNAAAPIARWNPCQPVRYRVNLDRSTAGALADVQGALTRLTAATGLQFTYQGTTAVIPAAAKGYNGTYPAGTDLIIAWADPGKQSTWMPNSNGLAGMGGGNWRSAYTATGATAAMFTEGRVVLNASMKLPAGFGAGEQSGWQGTRGQLLMHEIGHAVGLDHPTIKDTTEIMYPSMTHKEAAWGAGDLVGLRGVGKTGGCLSTTRPNKMTAATTVTTGTLRRA
jgi:hypothetical protein